MQAQRPCRSIVLRQVLVALSRDPSGTTQRPRKTPVLVHPPPCEPLFWLSARQTGVRSVTNVDIAPPGYSPRFEDRAATPLCSDAEAFADDFNLHEKSRYE